MKKKITSKECPHTCVVYTRVSSIEQIAGYSLSDQERACREYARRNGWEVVKLFREEGESAKIADRTQMNAMREYILQNQGKVGYIIVWKADRFSRNSLDHALLRKEFQDRGALLRSATEPIDETPYGRFFELLLSGVANLDNDVRSERTVSGMNSKARDGYWPVGAPWGYKNVKDELGKKIIVPDPIRAPIVKFLFEEYARGTTTFRELAKKVSTMGNIVSKHGCKINKQLVHKILKNPIHYGWVSIPKFGISVQGRHDAIISKELYFEVQFLMEGGKSRKQPRDRNNPLFPLKGLLCGGCSGSLTGGKVNGRSKKYDYYSCMNRACTKRTAIKKDVFEDDFTDFLKSKTPNPITLEALAVALAIVHEKINKDSLNLAAQLDKRLATLQEEMDALLQLRIDGEITNDVYSRKSEKQKAEHRELEIQKTTLTSPEESTDAAVRFAINVVKDFPVSWSTLLPGELRVLRKLFFPKNLDYQYPKFKTAVLAPIYNVKSQSNAQGNHYVTLPGIEPGLTA